MKKRKASPIEHQELKEQSGGVHSYERYVTTHGGDEYAQANPDLLPEQDHSPSTPQLIMGEAITHLQGRQKEVYIAIMRDDKSMAETAELLDITKGSVQVYLDRAIEFITAYCKQALARERI